MQNRTNLEQEINKMYSIKNMGELKVFEMPPVDYWENSIPISEMELLKGDEAKIYYTVCTIIQEISNEIPHTIKCGVVANPDDYCFHPIIYAKISNNGTTYAITDVDIRSISEDIILLR